MSENTTRLFHLDTEYDPHQNEDFASPVLLPNNTESFLSEDELLISPLAKPLTMRPSIDARLREGLKPVINDMSILKPENFHALSKATHATIANKALHEKAGEAREALEALGMLLKENIELMTFLNQCLNRVHKA